MSHVCITMCLHRLLYICNSVLLNSFWYCIRVATPLPEVVIILKNLKLWSTRVFFVLEQNRQFQQIEMWRPPGVGWQIKEIDWFSRYRWMKLKAHTTTQRFLDAEILQLSRSVDSRRWQGGDNKDLSREFQGSETVWERTGHTGSDMTFTWLSCHLLSRYFLYLLTFLRRGFSGLHCSFGEKNGNKQKRCANYPPNNAYLRTYEHFTHCSSNILSQHSQPPCGFRGSREYLSPQWPGARASLSLVAAFSSPGLHRWD